MVFKSVWTVIRGTVPSEKENVRATSRPVDEQDVEKRSALLTSRILDFDIESILRAGLVTTTNTMETLQLVLY